MLKGRGGRRSSLGLGLWDRLPVGLFRESLGGTGREEMWTFLDLEVVLKTLVL